MLSHLSYKILFWQRIWKDKIDSNGFTNFTPNIEVVLKMAHSFNFGNYAILMQIIRELDHSWILL